MDVICYLKLAKEQEQMLGPGEDRLGKLVDHIISETGNLPEEKMEEVSAAALPFGIRNSMGRVE